MVNALGGSMDAALSAPRLPKESDISIYDQVSNYTTWRTAKMNLGTRAIDGKIANGIGLHTSRTVE